MKDRVSIVVCTKDRREDLRRALASIADAGAEGAEIVVVEETDAPAPVAGTTYVAIPRESRGFGHARNRGVRAAAGEILVFFDDDCIATPGWLKALLEPLRADAAVAGVAGSVLVRDCGAIGYAESILGFPGGGVRYLDASGGRAVATRHLSTCNCAYRRSAVERAGGFVTAAAYGGEDALLAERVSAAARCVYAPSAAVYHRPRGRLLDVFRWFVRRGRSEIQILGFRADPRGATAQALTSSIVLRGILGLALLGLLRLPVGPMVAAVALAYYAAMLWRFRWALRWPSHRRAWALVPVVKLVMDVGTDVGRARELLARLAGPGGRA
ncbi:MAG TPA: glycosyltransferase family A protein [Methylomirabilota bacterium]|jgi:GT2 family glycosyltransferase|nr:glycosyltransferase family A protein [Methylomirabilota bacterium]